MDLDWSLIEYRPGRYAKVSKDGAFLGAATEAEVRAWFAASAPLDGKETAGTAQDTGQTPSTDPSWPICSKARPDSPDPGDLLPEPEEAWEKPLLWAPPRPGQEGQARDPATMTPEPEEAWEKPLIWAPPRPSREGQARDPATMTPTPEADGPRCEPAGRVPKGARPEPDGSWAKPMIWGRPMAGAQTKKGGPETPSLTVAPQATAPGTASPKPNQPDAGPTPHQVDPDKAAPEGLGLDPTGGTQSEPDVAEETVATDAGALEPASPTVPARSTEAKMVEEEVGLAVARPAGPGPEAPGPPIEAERAEREPAIPERAEPEPAQAQLGTALTEPSAPGARGPDASPAVIQVAMDLASPASITPDSPQLRPEPEPDGAGTDVTTSEPAARDGLQGSPEPEAGDEQAEAPGSEPAIPQTEEVCPVTGLDEAAPPTFSPKLPGPDAEETRAEPEGLDEESEISSEEADRSEPETEPPTPEPALLDAQEQRLEEQILDRETDTTPREARDGEFEPGTDDFASLPALAASAVSVDAGFDTGASGTQTDALEPDSPGAGELWLWVDPRYESGYSPATFDLSAFLQRAITLFQGKPWTGGHRPAKVAVHTEAAQDLEPVAESLGLAVVEDARVSNGTYWLGLGADGQPAETPGT